MSGLIAFVRLGRPLFLVGGFVFYALGVVIARWHGQPIDLARYAIGQLVVTLFQLMTHYANDYFDYEADRVNRTPTRWSGGSRVLVQGELAPRTALTTALTLAAMGVIAALVLARIAGAATLITCFIMLALAWIYSAPPLRLAASGVGEIDTALVVTVLVPWLGFSLQAPNLVGLGTFVAAIVPIVLLQIAMMIAVEIPDAAGDALAGKRTLVVRIGNVWSARLYALITGAAYLWLPLGYALGLPARVAIAAAILVPIAVWRIQRIAREHRDPQAYERITFCAVFLLVSTALAELGAFLL